MWESDHDHPNVNHSSSWWYFGIRRCHCKIGGNFLVMIDAQTSGDAYP
jgi:hypothetical protein